MRGEGRTALVVFKNCIHFNNILAWSSYKLFFTQDCAKCRQLPSCKNICLYNTKEKKKEVLIGQPEPGYSFHVAILGHKRGIVA